MKMFSFLVLIPIPPFYCREKTITPSKFETSNMMGMWLGILLLVPLLVMMMLGSKRRNDEDDVEVGSGGIRNPGEEDYLGEEEEDNESGKQTKPYCGNMFLGLQKGKGVEPLNLHASIAKTLTQVYTSMPESIFVGKWHGMEINK